MRNNQLPDGFITWNGGANPAPGKRVKYLVRYESVAEKGPYVSEMINWDSPDVVAYKVVEDEPTTPEGYHYWPGGACPVHEDVLVVATLRECGTMRPRRAGDLRWEHGAYPSARAADIIGYKIVDNQSPTVPFSTKFEIGKEYKTRNGMEEYKLAAIIPEAKYPLVFINVQTKVYAHRNADGKGAPSHSRHWDIVIQKRTVYVNLYEKGTMAGKGYWYRTAELAKQAASRSALAVAVPVEIEE